MRQLNQAKASVKVGYEKAQPTLTAAKNKIHEIAQSPATKQLIDTVYASPELLKAAGVLAFAAAVTATTRVTNRLACETDACTTGLTSTFVTTAALAAGAVYTAQHYGLFGKPATAARTATPTPAIELQAR